MIWKLWLDTAAIPIKHYITGLVLTTLYGSMVLTSLHYCDVIMGAIASQITSLIIIYSTVYSDVDQGKHQSSVSLAFVRGIHRWPVNSPHKWPVTRKMFPFDDVIMESTFIKLFHFTAWEAFHTQKLNNDGHNPWHDYMYVILWVVLWPDTQLRWDYDSIINKPNARVIYLSNFIESLYFKRFSSWEILSRYQMPTCMSSLISLYTGLINTIVSCVHHYCDVIMGPVASQITSLTIVYSTIYSDADQRKHQSSASLAFVRVIHRGSHICGTRRRWINLTIYFIYSNRMLSLQVSILMNTNKSIDIDYDDLYGEPIPLKVNDVVCFNLPFWVFLRKFIG